MKTSMKLSFLSLVLCAALTSFGQDASSDAQAVSQIKMLVKSDPATVAAYLEAGDIQKASELVTLAKKADQKYAPAYVVAGDILVGKALAGDAAGQYEQAIYFDPSCKDAYLKGARIYTSVNPGQSVEMLKNYSRWIHRTPRRNVSWPRFIILRGSFHRRPRCIARTLK